MKRVLTLQHSRGDPLGYLGEIMQEHGIPYDVVDVEESPLPDPTDYSAIISLGGPQHLYIDGNRPYFLQEKAAIRRAIEEDIPFLGICLGGQLLAQALHAPVTRGTRTELGFFEVQFTDEGATDPLFQGLPGHQVVFQWHMDTFGIPEGAVQLATGEHTFNQAFRFGHRAYGLEYHVELLPEMVDKWITLPTFKREVIKILGPGAPEILAEQQRTYYPIYREHSRLLFENFLKISNLL